ncbi:MAG: hypothetical protein MR998_06345 [Lachnospiraceae bacterium]|nr:hypothetical protein [Lachnospiraceae bacterium]
MVLCFNQKEAVVKQLICAIKAEVAKTPYSCAVGMAFNDCDQNFTKFCSLADQAMYSDKIAMKKQL